MQDKKQQVSIDKLKQLDQKNLPENVKKSIAEKQKALETNQVIRK
jgi:hypothetical protein